VTSLTHIQCHYVHGLINHRLRFGMPDKTLRLDKYRQLAAFNPAKTLGYIRWRANEYGTQDWRLYIVRTDTNGLRTLVPGVSPAVRLCCFINGPKAMKQALTALDRVEQQLSGGLESLPASYWLTFKSRLKAKNSSPLLPQKFVNLGPTNAV